MNSKQSNSKLFQSSNTPDFLKPSEQLSSPDTKEVKTKSKAKEKPAKTSTVKAKNSKKSNELPEANTSFFVGSPVTAEPESKKTNTYKKKPTRSTKESKKNEAVEEIIFDETNVAKIIDLKNMSYIDLVEKATSLDIKFNRPTKEELVLLIALKYNGDGKTIHAEGIVDILQEGYAFIRSDKNGYAASPDNIYISQNYVKKLKLKTGDYIECYVKPPRRSEKYFSLAQALSINEKDPDYVRSKNFRDLTPISPTEKLKLDSLSNVVSDNSTRIIDIVAPIGKGQRALIVAPPRTGKTVLMQNIAKCINNNHPEVHLIVLLIDERPEEVTDMRRNVKGEIVSSTFDESPERHVALAEIIKAKAQRLAEEGKDVIILLDSITRLARAYNTTAPSSGKVLSGGVDSNALQEPKRFFGIARNTEESGSLTIIATALVETGSRMDEVIFEEFKGRGNCEIVLERKIAERRIFPAINILKSGTRREDQMIKPDILSKMSIVRRIATHMNDQACTPVESIEFLKKEISKTDNNELFFKKMNS